MGITGWLLVWLILNALFVVWRILVTTEVETRDRSIRKMPNVADLCDEKRPQQRRRWGRHSNAPVRGRRMMGHLHSTCLATARPCCCSLLDRQHQWRMRS